MSAASLGELGPVTRQERISSIDVLRGFALLGLLPLNMNFTYWFPLSGHAVISLNVAHWYVDSAFMGTMRGLFSMLFGAGVVLLTSRAEASGRGAEIGDIYYRRLLWLLLFGVVHQYIILWGDILYAYAIAGLFLFPLRRLSPRVLILAGVLLLLFTCRQAIHSLPQSLSQKHARWVKAAEADAREAAGKTLSAEQKEAQRRWTDTSKREPADSEANQARIDRWRSMGYWASFREHNTSDSVVRQSRATYLWHFWDDGYMMLLGMALMKLGVFSASRSIRFYAVLIAVGYGIGLASREYRAYYDLVYSFDLTHYLESGTYLTFNKGTGQFFRVLVTLGNVGALVLLYKSGRLSWLMSSLAAVGRMAITNYIAQSIIITLVFNGYGFGLYGLLEYHQHFYLMLCVWIVSARSEPHLAQVFPLRSPGMALAVTHLLETAADAQQNSGARSRRVLAKQSR